MARTYNEYEKYPSLPKPRLTRNFYSFISERNLKSITNCLADMFGETSSFLNDDLVYWVDCISSIKSGYNGDISYSELFIEISKNSYIKISKQDSAISAKDNSKIEIVLFTNSQYFIFKKPVKISTLHTLGLCYNYANINLNNSDYPASKKFNLNILKTLAEQNINGLVNGKTKDINFDIFKFMNKNEFDTIQTKCETLALEKILKEYDIIPRKSTLSDYNNFNLILSYAESIALKYQIKKIKEGTFKRYSSTFSQEEDYSI